MASTELPQRILNVYALPMIAAPEELAGGVAVVIDVLRACTTIVYALAAGAEMIIPCLEVHEAFRIAGQLPSGSVLIGGERQGVMVEGFDLGNSPGEYTPEKVAGRKIVFTTTNGTQALARCRQAQRVYLGAFVNVSALCRRLLAAERIHLICAGTRGEVSRDDILLAGLIVERLQQASAAGYRLNAQAITARENWLQAMPLPFALGAEPVPLERLVECLRATPGGKNVVAIGCEEDIWAAAHVDRFEIVPELDPKTFTVRPAPG